MLRAVPSPPCSPYSTRSDYLKPCSSPLAAFTGVVSPLLSLTSSIFGQGGGLLFLGLFNPQKALQPGTNPQESLQPGISCPACCTSYAIVRVSVRIRMVKGRWVGVRPFCSYGMEMRLANSDIRVQVGFVWSYVDDETERHMETTTVVTVCLHCIRYDFCAILYSGGTVRVRVLSMRCGLLTRSYGYYGFVTYGYRFAFVSRRFFTCEFRRY